MRNIVCLLIIFLLYNCNRKQEGVVKENKIDNIVFIDTLEVFKDSINFGERNDNKIEIYKIGNQDSTFAKVYLYELHNVDWKLKDSLILNAVRVNDLETEIKDFNNDGFNDIIFTSGMAARGGNIVQTLILFSGENKSLNWIKNSENFPNLLYNEKLNCIDAVILTGGQTTYFLKIENDSLKEFASVDQSAGIITAKILEENGKWKEIKSVKESSENFDRFIDFYPIEKRK